MALFMISYDLRNQKDYARITTFLKDYNAHRILKSQWLLSAPNTLQEVMTWVQEHIDTVDDQAVVLKFTKADIKTHRAIAGTTDWLRNN